MCSRKALAFGEKHSYVVSLSVVSVSFLIKWKRGGFTVKATDHACEMQTCQGFSKWWLMLLF